MIVIVVLLPFSVYFGVYICGYKELFFFRRFILKLCEMADNAFDVNLLCLETCLFFGKSKCTIHLKYFFNATTSLFIANAS